jgi:hypothetical protein
MKLIALSNISSYTEHGIPKGRDVAIGAGTIVEVSADAWHDTNADLTVHVPNERPVTVRKLWFKEVA